jgi:hypothetical protein
MALAQTELPELKRFTFFVSRRFEEGRERFRLHMGYFATLAEAEEWLSVVREIYPGAWAGEAPGRRLRERAVAAAAAQAQHAAGPQAHMTPAPVRAPALPAAARPEPPPLRVPVVHAARPASPPVVSPPVARPAARPSFAMPAARAQVAMPAARAQVAMPRKSAGVSPAAQPPRAQLPAKTAPGAAARQPSPYTPASAQAARGMRAPLRAGTQPPAAAKTVKPVFEDSNVREVLKALGDASATGETRLMQAPPPPRVTSAPDSSLSDTQVLKVLELRRTEGSDAGSAPAGADTSHGGIPLLKPDDTGTRRALKEAVASNAPVSFAVQLQWSVQPADLTQVPALAIFSAYTLYTVEGSREGRKWYGLRLGFFSDAISAKQVAYYVRSEFASVAVVPVSPQEKARATDQDMKAMSLATPAQARSDPEDEFKLFDDPAQPAPTPAPGVKAAERPTPKVAVGRTVRQPAAPRAGRTRAAGKVGARTRSGPQTLEETLEILGASELTIDSGRGESINDSGVRHLRVEVQKNSPFSKLLERLSERIKKP